MRRKATLRTRFIHALIIYGTLALGLWFGYYLINYNSTGRMARENTLLMAENLIEQISSELGEKRLTAAVIAGSSTVQDFLAEQNKSLLYDKAVAVSEIISRTAFPISSTDSIVTINADGSYHRFSGGLSNQTCEALHEKFKNAGAGYTVVELDGGLFFCYNNPVFDMSGREPRRLGSVIMLTGLNKTRRILENAGSSQDIDTALILDGEIILSSNPALENEPAADLYNQYEVVSTVEISGTPLSVSAAIPRSALFPGRNLFVTTSFAFLGLLLVTVTVLYNYLSVYIVRPMADVMGHIRQIGEGSKNRQPGSGRLPDTGKQDFDELVSDINEMLDRTEQYNSAKQKMQMGLLSSQMDAHLVFNTLANIESLSDIGENEKTAQMANGLAILLRHQNKGDTMTNILEEFSVLEKYIMLMNIRHDGKYRYDYDLDDNLSDCLMPGFILQPIVENALMHGFGGEYVEPRLAIKGSIQGDKIRIEVSDNGAGIPLDKLKAIRDSLERYEIDDFPEPGLQGVALPNIQRRIRLQFGNEYGIGINSDFGKGTTVTVVLPHICDTDNPAQILG